MKFSNSSCFGAVALGASTLVAAANSTNSTTGDFADKCASFSAALGNSIDPSIAFETPQFVAAGTNLSLPVYDASCARPFQITTADLCRVALWKATSDSSGINMEAWLPANWTGRFLSTGNGGLGGCIQYEDVEYAASLGFAAVATNNGHNGTGGSSFLNSPEIIEDYAYRALHTGVVLGKKISEAFYGKPHTKSYYLGCSTGGRQGWKSVQTFPEDFDGVVAGAPAISFNNLTTWSGGFINVTGVVGSPTLVPAKMWPVIHADILKQCDHLDGVLDGVLEDPMVCKYDPSGLTCAQGVNSTDCLTPIQTETVRKTFSPLIDPDGSLVYPRMQPGSEIIAANTLYSGRVAFPSDWFKYAVLNDTTWDPTTINPDDWHKSQDQNSFNIQTWEGDISAFQNRGGKVLHYHGLMDAVISSENSPRYYEHVSQTMGLSYEQLDEFYRFFRISGMGHCSGGDGANFIGNQKKQFASLDPEENVLTAMVRWVEEGTAPEVVRGTKFVNGTAAYQRNHCRWPTRNTYDGKGNPNSLESWSCVKPDDVKVIIE